MVNELLSQIVSPTAASPGVVTKARFPWREGDPGESQDNLKKKGRKKEEALLMGACLSVYVVVFDVFSKNKELKNTK